MWRKWFFAGAVIDALFPQKYLLIGKTGAVKHTAPVDWIGRKPVRLFLRLSTESGKR